MITGRFYYEENMDLSERIRIGAESYRKTVGEHPNMCHVNPKWLDEPKMINNIYVVPDPRMAEKVVWVGVGKVD